MLHSSCLYPCLRIFGGELLDLKSIYEIVHNVKNIQKIIKQYLHLNQNIQLHKPAHKIQVMTS